VRALLFDFGPDLVRSSFEAMENLNSTSVRIFVSDTRPQRLHIVDRRYPSVDEPCVRRFKTLLWGEATRFCGTDLLSYSMKFASTPCEAIKNQVDSLLGYLWGLDLACRRCEVVDIFSKSLHIGSSIL